MTAVVSARGVVRRVRGRLGPVDVLAGVDVELIAGQVTGIVGPSLAGKTTLINVLAGWAPIDGGEVTWSSGRQPRWEEVAVIPQGFALLDELTVAENIVLPQRVGGPPVPPERLIEVCRDLGIAHLQGRLASEVSVGERQRTMAARALAARPACILADEPIAHQDERNGHAIVALLRAAAAAGAAVAIATRNPEVVDGVADIVVHLGGVR